MIYEYNIFITVIFTTHIRFPEFTIIHSYIRYFQSLDNVALQNQLIILSCMPSIPNFVIDMCHSQLGSREFTNCDKGFITDLPVLTCNSNLDSPAGWHA